MSDTLLSSSGNAFRKALLIEYPRKGCFTIAFMTGIPGGDVANHLDGDHVSVYVPTTPNPTSGFFLMLPRTEVVELDHDGRRGVEVHRVDGCRRAGHAWPAADRSAAVTAAPPPARMP